jgi:hypothetical protein
VAVKVIEDRTGAGWPAPVLIDSGNGYHLLWRVDLPADKLAQQWLKQALARLGELETVEAHVDRSVHNASRIAKLPGTWARKGSDTQERPHRLARLLQVPESLEVVTVEQIRELIGPEPTAPEKHVKLTASSGPGPDAYCRAALAGECAAVALEPDGNRNNRLNLAAFKLGGLLHLGTFSRDDVTAALTHAARRAGLTDRDIAQTIASGLDAGILEPREGPEREESPVMAKAERLLSDEESLVIGLEDVEPKQVKWLWSNRIARGFITLAAGRTGVGKSFVFCDFATRLSKRMPFPDEPNPYPPSRTLIISEDPVNTMLAPRFIELGADPTMIRFMTWRAMAGYSLDNLEMLKQAYDQSGRPLLIIIDPPANFLGGKDEHKNSEVRSVLMSLVTWLDEYEVACVLITHINKQVGKGIEALDRIMGSVAWGSTSRIALGFCKDPSEPARCLFGGLKNNLGAKAKCLRYEIEPTQTLAKITWHGETDADFDDALNDTKRRPRYVVAGDWLEDMFRRQREWNARELNRLAKEEGISRDALIEARQRAPLRWTRVADPHGDYEVVWRVLDPNWPPPKQEEPPES